MEHVDLEVFTETSKVIALVDNDPGRKDSRDRFEKKCRKAGVPFFKLERYAAENYLTLEAIREEYGSLVPDNVASIQIDKKLKDILGFSVKKRLREILSRMTLEDIENTDLKTFADKMITKLSEDTLK